jgi:hypothetical protein
MRRKQRDEEVEGFSRQALGCCTTLVELVTLRNCTARSNVFIILNVKSIRELSQRCGIWTVLSHEACQDSRAPARLDERFYTLSTVNSEFILRGPYKDK